ncbi:hypothetical protein WR25_15200 isoform A, partial [Diploscapter pachys]
ILKLLIILIILMQNKHILFLVTLLIVFYGVFYYSSEATIKNYYNSIITTSNNIFSESSSNNISDSGISNFIPSSESPEISIFDGCNLPEFDPFNNDAIKAFKPKTKSYDDCKPPIPVITKLVNQTIINTSKQHTCKARCLHRKDDFRNNYGDWLPIEKNKFACDIVETRCANKSSKNGTEDFGHLHAQIIKNSTTNKANNSNGKQYDIYILLLDSLGHTQSIRSLPLTRTFLENSFKAVTFPFINKIGINSRPNGIALWFGKQIERIVRAPMNKPDIEPDLPFDAYCGKKHLDNYT